MDSYLKNLTKIVCSYEGKHSDIIKEVPSIYELLCKLVGNPDIDTESRTKLLAVIGYFVIPNDVMNEDVLGPIGFIDDILISLYVINQIVDKYDYETVDEEWSSKHSLNKILNKDLPELIKEYKYEFNKIKHFIA